MKTCLICGKVSSEEVATCPNDGEASWHIDAAVAAEPAHEPIEEEVIADTDPAPEATSFKRSKK